MQKKEKNLIEAIMLNINSLSLHRKKITSCFRQTSFTHDKQINFKDNWNGIQKKHPGFLSQDVFTNTDPGTESGMTCKASRPQSVAEATSTLPDQSQ